jgi:hypothetical protein
MLIFLRLYQLFQDLGAGLVVRRNLERVAMMQGNARHAGFSTVRQHELGIRGAFAMCCPFVTPCDVRIDARYSQWFHWKAMKRSQVFVVGQAFCLGVFDGNFVFGRRDRHCRKHKKEDS